MILPPPTFPNSLPSAMFQKNSAEQTSIYGGVHRKVSSDLHQATGCRVGADLEKKILKQHSSTMDFQFRKTPFRNYMKPTRSSDAKRGKLRATVNSPTSSSPTASAKFSKVPSCGKKSVNRATCSSTLKGYKFPAPLVNNSEGKSKMRVCPYTYCCLNGHIHDIFSSSLPIKCFISEKRRILKNLRSVDKTLFLDKTGDNEEEEEKVGEEGVNDVIAEIPSDLFAEIYTMSREEMVEEKNCGEINIQGEKDEELGDCVFDENQCSYVLDQTSECSGDELDDVTANFLEYVEVDDEKKAREDYEFEENGDTKYSGIESMESDCDAEDDSEEEEPETEHSDGVSDVNSSPETASLQQSEDKSGTIEAINETIESMLNASSIDLSSKWNITRKMRAEEFEQVIEFNPKPPNFLPLEPDPEAEKVDLRHQMMDGRRNAEEWMIDYALQNTLTRLGDSAWKKKVAMLVEAFETVAPSHTCETPVSHGSSSFMNLCFIQTYS